MVIKCKTSAGSLSRQVEYGLKAGSIPLNTTMKEHTDLLGITVDDFLNDAKKQNFNRENLINTIRKKRFNRVILEQDVKASYLASVLEYDTFDELNAFVKFNYGKTLKNLLNGGI